MSFETIIVTLLISLATLYLLRRSSHQLRAFSQAGSRPGSGCEGSCDCSARSTPEAARTSFPV